ncbi:putative WSCD family member [Hypsibius exemplaris]|uniref:WSCD family member n=1 Tax=Hypsibius exemplaris TaxID=2072580 RepID=A0A1W0XBZ6_HYPEX|nr:putative WSCD family member [Hypsibius exemplaris]
MAKCDEDLPGSRQQRPTLAVLGDKFKRQASSFLHQVRCKWAVAVLGLVVGIIILASTVPIFPLGSLRWSSNEGPIGPQLDPKMRPCRSTLSFASTPMPRIALASFAGSGNTFLRGALEQITGIWTGSSVPDYQLYHGGFYGEVTNDEKVILIKTHSFGKKAVKANYKKAILLIRKPEDAILAKWNQYKTRTHTGIAKADTYDSRDWEYFAPRAITEWKELNEYWLSQNPATLHVVQFDELLKDKRGEIKKILDFLEYKDTDEDILNCVVQKYQGLFKRRKYKLDFEPFNTELKEQMENARDLIQQAVEEWKFSKFDTVELEE